MSLKEQPPSYTVKVICRNHPKNIRDVEVPGDYVLLSDHQRVVKELQEKIDLQERQARKYRSALDFADVIARLAKGKDSIVDDRIQIYEDYRRSLHVLY